MAPALRQATFVCRSCAGRGNQGRSRGIARYSSLARTAAHGDESKGPDEKHESDSKEDVLSPAPKPGPGAMARRLEEATEEVLLTGGASGRRAVEDAGFSEELKERLLDNIADADFRKQYTGAFAAASLTPSAGEGTRHIAAAQPWTRHESTEDAVLRMLDDSKKPLKPGMRGKFQPPPVDMRLRRGPAQSPGQRVASARDRASTYADMGMRALSEAEREEMKKGFRERFQPGARSMPTSASGLAAMANARIEDAIARGQFRDLPRGKELERDPRANSPFIDTTEYLMNRIIQRQEIVLPWIERQQELVQAARVFRERLRSDWKRHAARMIAAKGGPWQEQVRRAEEYAAGELLQNPRQRSVDQIPVPTNSTDHPAMVNPRKQASTLAEAEPGELVARPEEPAPAPAPFRDPEWERAEGAYLRLSMEKLNSIARSYNLMAPELAKKPYFSLQRELAACFADVAPLVANEIKERAAGAARTRGPALGTAAAGDGGIVGHLAGKDAARIHVEAEEKAYGLKEWWRDFWKKD
ncbi:hypothetical protein TOPH_01335 [Tolypocladium ophioglossoides CBS 100239]|uniref:DnaJ homologue subfamily C member 28 conserved domain-containing protein n=1 Tax=Tolypocladium ophioglossoides (strain CBS 100239) TaxID=1163406 RepID=A0A0L0NKG3_TOLOC|nr:hypothetical protein TOPH_01335 [Tolypocladium ophioglossoides CBS 100239]